MKATAYYFLVETPAASFSLIGGPLKPSKRPGHVWLTAPGGRPFLEVPRSCVKPSSKEQMAARILEEAKAARASQN